MDVGPSGQPGTPGWWQASDGRWYPPGLQPGPAGSGGPGPGGWTPLRWLVVLAAVLVALAGVALGVALSSPSPPSAGGGGGALPVGAASGTITVTSTSSGPTRFTGSVDGLALAGTASGTSSGGRPAYGLTGSFGGRPYDLRVSLEVPTGGSSAATAFGFEVTGTWGGQPVSGIAHFSAGGTAVPTVVLAFNGTVGSRLLAGAATVTNPTTTPVRIAVHFTVSAAA